jgi:hypothetical protein
MAGQRGEGRALLFHLWGGKENKHEKNTEKGGDGGHIGQKDIDPVSWESFSRLRSPGGLEFAKMEADLADERERERERERELRTK